MINQSFQTGILFGKLKIVLKAVTLISWKSMGLYLSISLQHKIVGILINFYIKWMIILLWITYFTTNDMDFVNIARPNKQL